MSPVVSLICLSSNPKFYGYFQAGRFIHTDGEIKDELAMNPKYFIGRPLLLTLSTLVHEMCHCHVWQEHFGVKKSLRTYHNHEWAKTMERVGLMPSNTGKEGGKKTGQKMTHYIIEQGMFETKSQILLTEDFNISWSDRYALVGELDKSDEEKKSMGQKQTRKKFTCPGCGANVWGKPTLNLICGDCDIKYIDSTAP